ncbi:biotin-(acetyl-CoA carboxylase) ligase [Bifidobacterium gallicum DSM 20093 = LMG 11596]|uniref:Biotin-(Acetyl-CoA carboxylase) ligase n=2 Tax=Bifidobacterium gallicum DSM 20093 = LMG 11596 TaxID=561180 RepID=A0A087AKX2_9BIFI|nr:biotin-(acetyl-CoA carboxylase) ligase [Bifidobacterium gallicum DSM 20093 = LMG 11596]
MTMHNDSHEFAAASTSAFASAPTSDPTSSPTSVARDTQGPAQFPASPLPFPLCRTIADVRAYDVVDSTNTLAAQLVASDDYAHDRITVVTAREQTAGRGRLDHTWTSVPDESFIASFIVRLPRSLVTDELTAGWVSMVPGFATVDALRTTVRELNLTWRTDAHGNSFEPSLKWPNDVVCQGLKLGGILTQWVGVGLDSAAVIFGIGLNLNIPADRLPTAQATSLQLVTSAADSAGQDSSSISASHARGVPHLTDCLAMHMVQQLQMQCESLIDAPRDTAARMQSRMNAECWTLGKPVQAHLVDGSTLNGTAVALQENASLAIRLPDGSMRTVTTGDVGVLPEDTHFVL